MSNFEILNQDLTAQIALVSSGQISAQQLGALQLARIEQLNPSLNAFISYQAPNIASGIKHTKLAGVSIAIKDNIDVNGFATTAGMATRIGRKPAQDAFAVEELRRSGASFIGKLNMHEGALGATNDNAHFGKCHNPHKIGFTPGGSSGGSACAVAAGMVAATLGTDTMGSTRIPAAYCGVFGFKPSRGAVSNRGSVACGRVMDNIGPVARSARDIRLMMSVLAKFDPQDAESVLYAFPDVDDKKFNKVLLVPENLPELGVEQSVAEDFYLNLDVFKALGFEIQAFNFDGYDFAAARRAGLLICEADMRVVHADDWANQRENFSEYMQAMLSYIDRKTPMDIIQAERTLNNAKVFARQLLGKETFLLMPTAPQRAFNFYDTVPANQADFTSFANQAGLPAISIPLLSNNVLPAGMQIVGPMGSDFQIIEIAERWQRLTDFNYSVPTL